MLLILYLLYNTTILSIKKKEMYLSRSKKQSDLYAASQHVEYPKTGPQHVEFLITNYRVEVSNLEPICHEMAT